jgi:inhibitor of cysteine peptidase
MGIWRPSALLFAVAMMVGVGCGANPDSIHVFGEETKDIRVKSGTDFALEVDSNITTGFTWQFADKLDEAVVLLVDEKYEPPKDTGKVGAGGRQRFTLRAIAPGTTTLNLQYVRPWEKPPTPNKELTFTVTVTGS